MENTPQYRRGILSWSAASFLVLVLTFVNVGISAPAGNVPTAPPPPVKAILKTADNRPISVNGSSASSGATILTGATIETPDQVGAVISLSPVGELELEPNSKVKLEFDENGNMKVTVMRGCATARTKKNIVAQFETEQGVAGSTDPKNRKNMTVCYPPGAQVPIISFPAGAAAVGGGKGLYYVFAAFIAAAVTIPAVITPADVTPGVVTPSALQGNNPSPSGL